MKANDIHCGRRGRRQRKALDKEARKALQAERAIQNEQKERNQAIGRLVTRLMRWSKLSAVGIVFVADKEGKKTFFSADGVAEPQLWSRPEDTPSIFTKWAQLPVHRLKILAQIRKFQIHQPKNPMLVLAETFAGLHDDIF